MFPIVTTALGIMIELADMFTVYVAPTISSLIVMLVSLSSDVSELVSPPSSEEYEMK